MRPILRRFLISHIPLLLLLAAIILAPKRRPGLSSESALLAALLLMELLFLRSLFRQRKGSFQKTAPFDLIFLVWTLLFVWEMATSVLHIAHPVLLPAPENVFHTFREQGGKLLLNVIYSMELLLIGFVVGLSLAVLLGLLAGWYPRLRAFSYPIANIMAPIPPMVLSPYLVSIMPSFRSASVLVIVLGVFWPNFLSTVNRVVGIDPNILDAARMLCPSNRTMICRILLPYIFPGIVSGLKVSLTSSLLMLNFAELMGATHGMGYYVQNSITYANYAHALAGIIVIGIVVTILSSLVSRLQGRLTRWH